MYDFQIVLYPCRVDALTEDIKGLNKKSWYLTKYTEYVT